MSPLAEPARAAARASRRDNRARIHGQTQRGAPMKPGPTKGNSELFSSLAHFLHSKVRRSQSCVIALVRPEGEVCKKYTVHPRLHHFLHRPHQRSVGEGRTCTRRAVESGCAENTGLGGSDPTFDGFQPPKVLWGRSRPSRLLRDRVLPACRSRRMQSVMHFVVHQEL